MFSISHEFRGQIHRVKYEFVISFQLPGMSQLVTSFWIDKYLSDAKCGSVIAARHFCLVHLTLVNGENQSIAPENYVFPSQLNRVTLPAANLRVNVSGFRCLVSILNRTLLAGRADQRCRRERNRLRSERRV